MDRSPKQSEARRAELKPADRNGFTLLEMIASLAIIGLFLTLLSFHLVALSNIWLSGSDDEFFDQHVDGVQLFLANSLEHSYGVAEGANEDAEGENTAAVAPELAPVRWTRPPHWSAVDPPLLQFSLAEAPALFVREGQHLPAIDAWLFFDDREGLFILWHSELEAEPPERVQDLYLTTVSPFITRIDYAYYDRDQDRWEIDDRPQTTADGTHILPHFLRFTFEHQNETRERLVYIPQQTSLVPRF